MKTFECPICNLHYEEETLAKKCEEFCSEHKSCSLEIIKHALENK